MLTSIIKHFMLPFFSFFFLQINKTCRMVRTMKNRLCLFYMYVNPNCICPASFLFPAKKMNIVSARGVLERHRLRGEGGAKQAWAGMGRQN
ncbi:hypothetical protein J3Q64DRAFT_1727718, partial [Phycomyces blakesleeanus]